MGQNQQIKTSNTQQNEQPTPKMEARGYLTMSHLSLPHRSSHLALWSFSTTIPRRPPKCINMWPLASPDDNDFVQLRLCNCGQMIGRAFTCQLVISSLVSNICPLLF